MLREGSWWIKSSIDERWNLDGRGLVGMFMSYKNIPEAIGWIEACEKRYGERPYDLEFGYMKD